jgi:hypothetical protein
MRIDPKLACVALLLQGGVALAESSPWYVAASQSYSYESNLLRLATGQETPLGYSRNDDVWSTALLAGLDQPIGRQRIFGNLTLRKNRYSGNPQLNNTSYNASAGIDWSTIERISGSLSASANRALQTFSPDLFTSDRLNNLESTETLNGSIAVGLVTQYSVVLNAGHRQVRNSLSDPGIRSREYYQDNAELSLRWAPSSNALFGIGVGVTRGSNPKFAIRADGEYQADRFKRNDLVLTAALRPSGASTVDIRLANGETRYDLNRQRDFSGVTGSLGWNWQATGKLRLNTQLSRETGQDSYATRTLLTNQPTSADFSRVNDQLRVQAYYDLSAKIGVNAGASYGHRDVVRTINDPLIPPNASGEDRTRTLAVGARWSPRRYSMLGCDVSMEKRKGSGDAQLASDMQAKALSCFGQLTLQ